MAALLLAVVAASFIFFFYRDRDRSVPLAPAWTSPPALDSLLKTLREEKFAVRPGKAPEALAYGGCAGAPTLEFHGNGIRTFFAESTAPVRSPIGTVYPDFHMDVLELGDAGEAANHARVIREIDRGSASCPKLVVREVAVNGRYIYVLDTRAEMFRDWTRKYAKLVASSPMR